MSRCIVLDTETTGLDPRQGHRIIEVACVELIDHLPTGKQFHRFVYPDRDIDADAERVHGISLKSLVGQPRFHDSEVCDDLMNFIGDAPIVAHNASFDRGFINNELALAGRAQTPISQWIDSLAIAQQKFPGGINSLNGLCKRFKISLEDREKHGALIDAQLLAEVYLELHGGRERRLELGEVHQSDLANPQARTRNHGDRPGPVHSMLTDDERSKHEAFIGKLGPQSIWARLLAPDECVLNPE